MSFICFHPKTSISIFFEDLISLFKKPIVKLLLFEVAFYGILSWAFQIIRAFE